MDDRFKRFVTVEGIEGVGKSTAMKTLSMVLEEAGEPYVLTREPGGTPLAESIRQLLLGHHDEPLTLSTELLLMYAARMQHLEQLIMPKLDAGYWVLSDRFNDATLAYQGGGRQWDPERLKTLKEWCLGDVEPGLTLWLDAPLAVTMERLDQRGSARDRIEEESWDFFSRVRERYLQIHQNNPHRVHRIDASGTLYEVGDALELALRQYLENL